jgi:hypothetical protein
MDLRDNTFHPYMKPNNTPLYVNKNSNHPPNITKNIPESINRRLSTISSDESSFYKAAPDYQQALENSGYKHKLKFDPHARKQIGKTHPTEGGVKETSHGLIPPTVRTCQQILERPFLNSLIAASHLTTA